MKQVKISVIIPIYNSAKYISRCLDSIINQDYSDLEIICVNDGSTDNSLEILEEYASRDKRIKVVSQSNQGAAAARNRGMDEALGDYISFIDADDFMSNGIYSYFVSFLSQSETDIFMFNGKINGEGGFFSERNFYHKVEEGDVVTYKDFYGIFYGNSGVYNKIYGRDFLQKNHLRFLEDNSFEDIDFWFRSLILAKGVRVCFSNWYNYMMDNQFSVTKTLGKNSFSIFDTFASMTTGAEAAGLKQFFDYALFQFEYEKLIETMSLMDISLQEEFFIKSREFLHARCLELNSRQYTRLLNYGLCHNMLTNSYADFKNTTLLVREQFKYQSQKIKKPRFSIIVPVYNVEKYVGICLKSLINQSFSEFEIICINDGSTDNSLQILEHHARKDGRIKIINQANQGLGAARNVGIKAASGEYLLFVDSDDWIRTDALEILDKHINKQDIDVCIFGYGNFIDTAGYNLSVDFLSNLIQNPREHVYEYMFANVTAWGKVYRREFWVENDIKFAKGVYFEDVTADCKVFALAKSMSICEYNLYYYRARNNSITQGVFSDKKVDDLFLSLQQAKQELENYQLYINLKEDFIRFCHNCLKYHASRIGKDKIEQYQKRCVEFLRSL